MDTKLDDYLFGPDKDKPLNNSKSTDINILLNRVKLNQRNESRKKLYFSAKLSPHMF